MTKEKLHGMWWLPEAPEKQVAGTLVVSGNGRQELRLIGSLRDPWAGGQVETAGDGTSVLKLTPESIESSRLYPRIHGIVGATSYDLEDCFQVSSSMNLFGGVGAEKIHVHKSYSNIMFDIDEKVEFSRARVSLLGLAHWVMKTGLERSISFKRENEDDVKDITHQIKISRVQDVAFEGPNGENLALSHNYRIRGDQQVELQFRQDFEFIIRSESLKPEGYFTKQSSALQDLLTIAIGRPSELLEIVFQHPDAKQTSGDKVYYLPIVGKAQRTVHKGRKRKPLNSHDVIFSLDDFGGPAQLVKWLQIAESNRSTLSRVMATKYSPHMYASDIFFSCAAALEAYERAKANGGGYYVDCIKRCAQHAGAPFESLVGDIDQWANLVKGNRNTVAHHNADIVDATTAQIVLGRSAFWLFVFCLLRDIDAPELVFEKLLEASALRSLARDVAGLLAET